MTSRVVLATAVIAFGAAGGRGQEETSPHEAVVKEMLAGIDKLTAVLATIKDEATATEARPELKKAVTAFLATRKKAASLPQPGAQERDRVSRAYRKKLADAVNRYLQERGRVSRIAAGRDALAELAPLAKEIEAPPAGKKK